MLDDLKEDLVLLLREPNSNQEAINRISKKIKVIENNNIKEFLSNKKDLLSDLKFITANFEDMGLNDNENFDYPFSESFDEIVSELEETDFEKIKDIHSKMVKSLEEAIKGDE